MKQMTLIAEPAHVVALSGGKDSVALALRLRELNPQVPYTFLFTPTGDEMPDMVEHLAHVEELLGTSITRVTATRKAEGGRREMTLYDLIDDWDALPNHRARWCTRTLKIQPCLDYFRGLPKGSVLYVGLRADEEVRQGLYSRDIDTRFPLRDWGWGLREVVEYVEARGVRIPKRTDCALCYAQRLPEWYRLWRDFPEMYERGAAIEERVSESRGRACTFRSPQRDTWPASLRELAGAFETRGKPRGQDKYDDEDGLTACRVCRL